MWVVFRPLQANPQKKKNSKQTVAKSFYSWFKLDIRLLQLLGCWIFAPIPKICRKIMAAALSARCCVRGAAICGA